MRGEKFHLGNRLTSWFCLLAVAVPSVFCSGCGSSGQQRLEGTVTLDGKPLEKGHITFRPQPGTASPSAGATIVNGAFSVATKGGLLPGKFRVEITAPRLTGKTGLNPFSGEMVPLEEQFIPAAYNSKSSLEAVVQSGGPNRFEFTMTSK